MLQRVNDWINHKNRSVIKDCNFHIGLISYVEVVINPNIRHSENTFIKGKIRIANDRILGSVNRLFKIRNRI